MVRSSLVWFGLVKFYLIPVSITISIPIQIPVTFPITILIPIQVPIPIPIKVPFPMQFPIPIQVRIPILGFVITDNLQFRCFYSVQGLSRIRIYPVLSYLLLLQTSLLISWILSTCVDDPGRRLIFLVGSEE